MATQTLFFYQNMDGSTLTMTYDSVALTSSFMSIHVSSLAAHALVFNLTLNGLPQSHSFAAGSNTTLDFGTAWPVVMTTSSGNTYPTMAAFGKITVASS